jgi:fructokinase
MARIIVFGEILWDCLPSGPRLGGAPLNAAANLGLLGNEVFLVSAVGKDEFGDQAIEMLRQYKVNTDFVALGDYSTGTVEVSLDERGDASYTFTPNCAWHHIGELLNDRQLPTADALLYGSLANHSEHNWLWLQTQLNQFPGQKFCDINLREPWNPDLIQQIANTADILKCNESEYEALTGTQAMIQNTQLLDFAKMKNPSFPNRLCITFGETGALYFTDNFEVYYGTTNPVEVVDSIGAGDAFMAGLVDQLVFGEKRIPENFLYSCCKLGAEAASREGALPEIG